MGGPTTTSGAKLGRYQIVKHLASGGMAEVLLARATGIEGFTRHVVIKRIRPGQAKDQTFVQMFLNEARLAAQLHHANIVQVHDIGQEGNEYFFAMEYVHGEDLRRLLTQLARHKQQLPLEHLVTIISAAAVALHHAHEQRGPDRKPLGIVHRDVTPANILVGYDGNVKVVDFGIAKAAARTEETQAGTLKGKASYMSPEQCTGSRVDRRSDVFALGIVLYELVTTRRLFKSENDFLTMSAIVGGKVPSPKTHRPDLPDALEAIILKALALKPEDRYQTADAVREALEQFAITAGLRTSTSALASFMKLQFGERPEPWLVDDEEPEMELTVDFDGSASALVPPPEESLHQLAIPLSVEAVNSSPIVKARTKAITNQPSNAAQVAATPRAPITRQMPLAPPGPPKRTLTAQIPAVTPVMPLSEKSRPFRIDTGPAVAPPPPPPPRRKPITVQIPTASQTAGITSKRSEFGGGLPGVGPPKPHISDGVPGTDADENDSAASTFVAGSPNDVDDAWEVSAAISAIQKPDPVDLKSVAATSMRSDAKGGAAPTPGGAKPGETNSFANLDRPAAKADAASTKPSDSKPFAKVDAPSAKASDSRPFAKVDAPSTKASDSQPLSNVDASAKASDSQPVAKAASPKRTDTQPIAKVAERGAKPTGNQPRAKSNSKEPRTKSNTRQPGAKAAAANDKRATGEAGNVDPSSPNGPAGSTATGASRKTPPMAFERVGAAANATSSSSKPDAVAARGPTPAADPSGANKPADAVAARGSTPAADSSGATKPTGGAAARGSTPATGSSGANKSAGGAARDVAADSSGASKPADAVAARGSTPAADSSGANKPAGDVGARGGAANASGVNKPAGDVAARGGAANASGASKPAGDVSARGGTANVSGANQPAGDVAARGG
ncbi:MAG TPA: protein kinase, partial [Kofleriaceae bacterium]